MSERPWLRQRADDQELLIKVVPGSSQERVAGTLGDRLKVQVREPPSDGRANVALLRLLAAWLDCSERDLQITHGATQAWKTVRLPVGCRVPVR